MKILKSGCRKEKRQEPTRYQRRFSGRTLVELLQSASEDLLKAANPTVNRALVELGPAVTASWYLHILVRWMILEIRNACRISNPAPDVSVLTF